MKIATILFVLVIVALALKSYAENKVISPKQEEAYKTAVDVSNKLNSVIFQDLAAEKKDENLFISSYSVTSALNLAYAGATGVSKAEFESLYGIPAENNLHESYASLFENLKANSGDNQVLNANALWVDDEINLLPEYKELTGKFYRTTENKVDFIKADNAAEVINKWVADNTNQMIKKLVSPLDFDEYTRLVLTNAIYFKSVWSNEFKAEATYDSDFNLLNGAKKQVPTMSSKFYIKYADGKGFKIAELPYRNSSYAMTIILPEDSKQLDSFLPSLADNIGLIDKQTAVQAVYVSLPKFKFESAILDFSDILQKHGLAISFSDDAKFENITHDRPLKISKVLHKAAIEVNEKGTEAAAATAVIMALASGMPTDKPAEFYVDKPFIFVIRDTKTGLILFAGKITNPAS